MQFEREQTLGTTIDARGVCDVVWTRIVEADRTAPTDAPGSDGAAVAALRALFVETGILLAKGADRWPPSVRRRWREQAGCDPAGAIAAMASAGLCWRTSLLHDAGVWRGPASVWSAGALHLFLCELDPAAARADEPTADRAWVWSAPTDLLVRFSRGELSPLPWLLCIARTVERGGKLEAPALAARVREQAGKELDWELVEGVRALAVRTPTLPPATHTNAYLLGSAQALLVEPAPEDEDEIDALVRWVDEAIRRGVRPIAIVATHHHRDHVGAARALCARLSLPLWAHRETARRLASQLRVDRWLQDGDRIELAGAAPTRVQVLHTPGHAPGHLCLLEERTGALVAGDMVAGVGTILVDPDDGDMSAYLASLERLAALRPAVLLPAHGGPLRPAVEVLERYVTHRRWRERRVLDAVRERARPVLPHELLARVYDDVPSSAWPLAVRSVESHLLDLQRRGLLERRAEGWMALEHSEPRPADRTG
ncbi:MAG: MBL fold metallo-hydrolase [Myxococcota bacterium]|nr:MBL fold metallo-hydrolase [Myxococcota bacterium]MDW8361077.1 MBL fold metallo-hydrolase [Myxococcales bacterium]